MLRETAKTRELHLRCTSISVCMLNIKVHDLLKNTEYGLIAYSLRTWQQA